MTTITLRSSKIPPALRGPICVAGTGLPRFYATLWLDVFKASLKSSSLSGHAFAIDAFYNAVQKQTGHDCLDRLISDFDFDAIESCLLGFLSQLRNDAAIKEIERSKAWSSVIAFVLGTLELGSPAGMTRSNNIRNRLTRLDILHATLRPTKSASDAVIRALPPSVVEDLYQIFTPGSPRNPFKTRALQWRNLLIFLLLLRLGLRRSEAGLLLTNSLKEDWDPRVQKHRRWLDVFATDEIDPRYEKPSLKTSSSRRQLPVTKDIWDLWTTIVANYRGGANVPFMFVSQKNGPLSLRSISEVIETASRSLSAQATEALELQNLPTVSCHDLRHACAVMRLQRWRETGTDLETAQEHMRVFFGWSRESTMPRLYARAYFESSLAPVWDETYDQFVDVLRRAQPEPNA